MSGFKGMLKEGWHPKGKDASGKESWRGDFKGINQVAGWLGKGRDTDDTGAAEHTSKPLSSLKDPASFGPPPKHIKYHGAAAVPDRTTPDRRGLGAPLSEDQIASQNARQQEAEMEDEQPAKPQPPQLPFRADRTGLSRTTNLPPPPPTRRMDSSPNSASTASFRQRAPPPPVPPRRDTLRSQSPSPPPAYSPVPSSADYSDGHLNPQATSNLARSGVSVPALGIGESNNSGNAPVNELQSRFDRMNTNSTSSASPAPPPPAPARGMNTSSIKSSIHDFRDRHSDQIDAGKQKISGINEKYGISRRVNNFIEDQKSPAGQGPPPPPHPNQTSPADAARRKAPPPPPPKKPEMRGSSASTPPASAPSPAPPPVPLATKPR